MYIAYDHDSESHKYTCTYNIHELHQLHVGLQT